MNSNSTISVIMACYNSEKTLERAIDSILDQTYQDWIMICCDDGSVDNTWNILCRYKEEYPDKFIILKNKKNRQLPYSLNRCLKHVKTDLVARMDADDWSMPDRFEKQVAFLREHPEYDLVSTGVTVSNGREKITSIIKIPNPTKETMIKDNAFSHATILTYKRVYDELGGYSLDPMVLRVEDVDLWCRFLAKGFKGYNMPDELYAILENDHAVKRRNLQARINSARTRYHGYKLMGFKGLVLYKPYLIILWAFIPTGLYNRLHRWRLERRKRR